MKADNEILEQLIKDYKELQHLISNNENSIINMDVLGKSIEMKRKEILENYPNKIWKASDGRWKTRLPNEERQLIAKSTREKLEQAILDFYVIKDKNVRRMDATLEMLYPEWLKRKIMKSASTTYGPRLHCDWKKYYMDDEIIQIPIVKLDSLYLEAWAYDKINNNGGFKMTRTQYYNATTIIRGILDYAVRLRIIKENPYRLFDIENGHFRRVLKKKAETQVYLETEELDIIEMAEKEYNRTGYTACLAVCLNFYLGLRVGELMGLQESDRDGNILCVQRQEIRNQVEVEPGNWKTRGYVIDDYLKADKEVRELYLTVEARRYWDMIVEHNKKHGWDGDYLIVHNGRHVHQPTVNKRLKKYCEELGIPSKTNHSIRKTVLSTMVDKVGLDEAQEWGGHSSKSTLLKNYVYSRKTSEKKEQLISEALSKKCNHSVTAQ